MSSLKNDSKKSGAVHYTNPDTSRSMAERIDGDQLASQQRVAERAHEKFVARGSEHGHDAEDWISAEAEIASERQGPRDEPNTQEPRTPSTHDGLHLAR